MADKVTTLEKELKGYFIATKLSKSCDEVAGHHPKSTINAAVFDTAAVIYPTGSVLAPKNVWCRITPPRLNLALVSRGKPAVQSSLCSGGQPHRAVDGNYNPNWGGGSVTHTCRQPAWWRLDLKQVYKVKRVSVWNRYDCCWSRLASAQIRASKTSNVVNTGAIPPLVSGSFGQRSGEIRSEYPSAIVSVLSRCPRILPKGIRIFILPPLCTVVYKKGSRAPVRCFTLP